MVEKAFFMNVREKNNKTFNQKMFTVLCAKMYSVEKNHALCIFSKVIKNCKLGKIHNIQSSVFFKRSIGRFPFFFTSNFLITFEKIQKA